MKIVFSTDQMYLLGGIEKVTTEKANYLAESLGYEVAILTSQQQNRSPYFALSPKVQLIDMGINYVKDKSYFSLANLSKVPKHIFKLRGALKSMKPDIVITPNLGFDCYVMPFIYRRAKKIREIHGSRYLVHQQKDAKGLLKKIRSNIDSWIESKYDTIVVLNSDEQAYYKGNNVVVIPNPITVPEQKASLDNKLIVAAGRIAPVKGFDKLIEAWKIVHHQEPEWNLHIYGDDYLQTRRKLEQLIKDNKLDNVIYFKGASTKMIVDLLQYSVYAMSSITDCFPMVLLEALSIGLPIVSFDCPNGPRNIITDKEDGLLVQDQIVPELAKNILLLIEDEKLRKRMGDQAKVSSLRFSTPKVMQLWVNLFKSITN